MIILARDMKPGTIKLILSATPRMSTCSSFDAGRLTCWDSLLEKALEVKLLPGRAYIQWRFCSCVDQNRQVEGLLVRSEIKHKSGIVIVLSLPSCNGVILRFNQHNRSLPDKIPLNNLLLLTNPRTVVLVSVRPLSMAVFGPQVMSYSGWIFRLRSIFCRTRQGLTWRS